MEENSTMKRSDSCRRHAVTHPTGAMKKRLLTLGVALQLCTAAFAQLGSIDPDFNLGTGFGPDQWTGKCETVVQQSDGKLLVGGSFETFNGNDAYYIARLNDDGSNDASFSSPFTDNWGYVVHAIVVQNDGKIIIGGEFSDINGVARGRIARLNSDGSLDLTFDPGSGFNQMVTALALQPDGKVIVGGLFTVFDYVWGGSQTPANGIARLNADGSLDATFNIGTGFSGGTGIGQRQLHAIVVQPDGKIVIGGHYSSYNGNSTLLMTRLNNDGTFDNSFNANSNFSPAIDGFYGQIYAMKLLPDGKWMIGGNYGNTNSIAEGVDRLNADGSLDNSFVYQGAVLDTRCFALDVQSDGKVVLARVNFGGPNEVFVVERYEANGATDSNFPGRLLNNDVKDLIIQNDGKITFAGYFNYNPTGLMRLIGDTPSSAFIATHAALDFTASPNPVASVVTITGGPQYAFLRMVDVTGKVVLEQQLTDGHAVDVSGLENGMYTLQLEHNGSTATKRLVINQ